MRELIVDNFAGGGGASTGIELAIGRSVDIAINHDPNAIAMHSTNHPSTLHYCESVFDVDPVVATSGYPVGLAWFSPDCTHFSKARGTTPVKKEIRALAWIVIRWVLLKRPRVIMLENVEEFKTWGPTKINEKGEQVPDPEYQGQTFKAFVDMLTTGVSSDHPALDEVCEVINLNRNGTEVKSLINGLGYDVDFTELKACDYGAPTIRKRFFMVMRCDGQKIVWPVPTHGDPKLDKVKSGELLPYRTAAECIDWSLPCPSIFGRKKSLAENTLKRIARGIQRFVIDNPKPFIVGAGGPKYSAKPKSVSDPINTIPMTNHSCLVSPVLTPFIARIGQTGFGGDRLSYEIEQALTTITTKPEHLLCTAFLAKHFGGNYSGSGYQVKEPAHTITAKDHNAVVTSHLVELRGFSKDGRSLDKPIPTITAGGGHLGEVRAFLLKYYGSEKECPSLSDPLHTVTAKDRFGLVTIKGVDYQIVDIGMRMLQPHELYKAQGFPDWYIIDQDYLGNKYPKSKQVARCGNAVPPPFAESLVRANLPELCAQTKVA